MPMPGNLFWPCEGKRKFITSCDNWNDQRKIQHGKTAWKDVGMTNKVATSRASDRPTRICIKASMLKSKALDWLIGTARYINA